MDFSVIEVNNNNFTNEVINKSAEKPVLVYFYATWCPSCQDLSPRLEQVSSDYNLVLARVDVDQNPELVQEYGVRSFPDVQLITDGEVVDGFLGALPNPLIRDFFLQNTVQPSDLLLGGDGNETLTGSSEKDNLDGGLGNDELFGLNGDDLLFGSSGNDILRGESGDDYLWGGPGNDRLLGGNEDDYIWGGEGDDLLEGSAGNDILTGNNGIDTFVLNAGKGVDVITDFELGLDVLEFYGGISSQQLAVSQIDTNTVIEFPNETFGILTGINSSELIKTIGLV